MVGGGDDDGVDVGVGEEVVVVGVSSDAVVGLAGFLRVEIVDELFALNDAVGGEIADSDDAGGVTLRMFGHVVAARDTAYADGSDVDLFAGGELAEDARREDDGEAWRQQPSWLRP